MENKNFLVMPSLYVPVTNQEMEYVDGEWRWLRNAGIALAVVGLVVVTGGLAGPAVAAGVKAVAAKKTVGGVAKAAAGAGINAGVVASGAATFGAGVSAIATYYSVLRHV